MTLTPTAQSSVIAGFTLWFVGWMTFFKADHLPLVGKFIRKERMIDWISRNKALTLMCTEVFNFGAHGISNANSVTFALGGTAFNALMIFVLLPLFKWRGRKSNNRILREAI
ncbi:MAG: hypothetical protein ACLGSH_18175 [Acidobacteriota bacterium]